MNSPSATRLKRLFDALHRFATQRAVYHTAFWLAILLLLTVLERSNRGWLFALSYETINVAVYALIVYFNLWYLIPNYLTEKKLLRYFGLLILSVLIVTPLKVLLLYVRFMGIPEFQQRVIADQNWLFITMFFVTGTSTIIKIVMDWARHQRDRKELETQTMQSELKFLRSQINPHFLFNTLNNLYALTLKKSDIAPDIVLKLSEMMRYMLYECNERRVPLAKEVNYLRNYLDLEKLRQGKNVDIAFEMSGELGNQKIAPLLFIPFVENSFKHGLNNHLSRGFVHINMSVSADSVHLYIENSKPDVPPMLPNEGKRSGGIGLVNVRRRLNLLYPNQYRLDIIDKPHTYAVDFEIELN